MKVVLDLDRRGRDGLWLGSVVSSCPCELPWSGVSAGSFSQSCGLRVWPCGVVVVWCVAVVRLGWCVAAVVRRCGSAVVRWCGGEEGC